MKADRAHAIAYVAQEFHEERVRQAGGTPWAELPTEAKALTANVFHALARSRFITLGDVAVARGAQAAADSAMTDAERTLAEIARNV